MKRALLMFAMTAALSGQTAQTPTTRLYGSYSEATPSGAAVVVTIQQPSTGARQLVFEGATIYCSVACVPALEINGAAATATAGTATKLDTRAPAATAAVFTGSDVGAGTVINRYPIAAGGQTTIFKAGLTLGVSTGVRQNLTIRTDSISGTVRILLMWSEPQ
jgi:hypothetical protein